MADKWLEIDRYLQSVGVRIGAPTVAQTTGGVHTPTSYHYKGQARDYGSATSDMRAVWDALLPFARRPGYQLVELFGPWGAWKAGEDIHYVSGHTDHVHAAILLEGHLGASQSNPEERKLTRPCLILIPHRSGYSPSFQRRPVRAIGSSSRTGPSSASATPRISAVSQYRRTSSPNDHDHPENGWPLDANGWELAGR